MFALAFILCPWLVPQAAAVSTSPAIPYTGIADISDPVGLALGEEVTKAKTLPAALQKKAEQGLSTLLTVALVLVGCVFILALIKTAYGAIRGDGYIWAGALALVVSALCFVAVLHAKTLLYLMAQYATAP
jgi:hypothetical protein